MSSLNLTSFYSDKTRLSYNPINSASVKRYGIKRLIAFDDRFLYVSRLLNSIIRNSKKDKLKMLDIGVGDAVYESLIQKDLLKKIEITGVDISKEQLKRAKNYLKRVRVVNLDKGKLPFRNTSFDIVLISEVLEHIFYPDKVLREAERVFSDGGYLILTYPNSGALQLRLSLLFTGFSPLLNFSKNKEHIRFFKKSDILSFLPKNIKINYYQGLGSFLFTDWNFGKKIIMPRILEIFGNKYLPQLALGNLLVLTK